MQRCDVSCAGAETRPSTGPDAHAPNIVTDAYALVLQDMLGRKGLRKCMHLSLRYL